MTPTDSQYSDTVTNVANNTAGLPNTGLDLIVIVAIAVALLVVGVLALRAANRQRP